MNVYDAGGLRVTETEGRMQPYTVWDDRERNWRGSFVIVFTGSMEEAMSYVERMRNVPSRARR